MPGGLTELYENRQMANYRDALRVAARILRISKQKDLPVSDKMFLATEAAVYALSAAQNYKAKILLFNSFVPWADK